MIKKINKALAILFLFCLSLIFSQCNSDSETVIEEIDTKNIDYKLQFNRFDKDLFSATSPLEISKLEIKYPDFYPVYMYQLMGDITQTNQSALEAAANLMRNFTTVSDFGLMLKQRTDSVFADMEPFKGTLTQAMKRYKYLFPKDTIPQFITFISPLRINFPVIEGKHVMGIGLDMYLGSDFKPYKSVRLADQFPNYRIRKMRKDYLLRDLMTAMSENKIKATSNDTRLIDEMITEGKIIYMVKNLIPETSDSIILGYTPNQLKWAIDNEAEIWAALVDTKVLYITKPEEIRHYINDGPFTTASGFGAGTAPRIGAFTGYQIIKKYMLKNPKLSVADLLKMMDTDQILTQSKYKP